MPELQLPRKAVMLETVRKGSEEKAPKNGEVIHGAWEYPWGAKPWLTCFEWAAGLPDPRGPFQPVSP